MPGIIGNPQAYQPAISRKYQKNSRFDRWLHGWLLGGLGQTGRDFAHSVDPRTPEGLIGALSMMVPGKASGEGAMAAHLGHTGFRPYHAVEGRSSGGPWKSPDQQIFGGQNMRGIDSGYSPNMHGIALPELLGLRHSNRIKPLGEPPIQSPGFDRLYEAIHGASPNMLHDDILGLLKKPYRTYRGMNN